MNHFNSYITISDSLISLLCALAIKILFGKNKKSYKEKRKSRSDIRTKTVNRFRKKFATYESVKWFLFAIFIISIVNLCLWLKFTVDNEGWEVRSVSGSFFHIFGLSSLLGINLIHRQCTIVNNSMDVWMCENFLIPLKMLEMISRSLNTRDPFRCNLYHSITVDSLWLWKIIFNWISIVFSGVWSF